MAKSPAARRYAKAVFETAREKGKLDALDADFAELGKIVEQRETYYKLLSPYALSVENRQNIWRKVLGDQADPLTLRFILFLIHKNRIALLGEIIGHFNELYNDAKGMVSIRIVSAIPLADTQADDIARRFETRLGKKIRAVREINPELLGGFQVRVGDVVHDYSIDHQLNLLHRKLLSA